MTYLERIINRLRFKTLKDDEKIFCIGLNKTGTTSLKQVLYCHGYKIGIQSQAEKLLKSWHLKDYAKIIDYCRSADAFQDVPFSLPHTFQYLYDAFPKAKFILTVRDSDAVWYRSLVNFHSKLYGNNDGTPPTTDQLKNSKYIYKGRPFDFNQWVFKAPSEDPYNEEILKNYYTDHVSSVKQFFSDKPNKLIEINVSKAEDYIKLCEFLNIKAILNDFKWENKT